MNRNSLNRPNFQRQNSVRGQNNQDARPRQPVYDCLDTIQEHRYPTIEELRPIARANLPWKMSSVQKDSTYNSFTNVDVRAELLIAAKFFAETYIEAAEKLGVDKFHSLLNDLGVVERSIFIILNKNRNLMNQFRRQAVLPTAVFINCVNLGIISLIIKLDVEDGLEMDYEEIMDFLHRIATQEDETHAEIKKLISMILKFDAYDQIKDIARVVYLMFTSITNPSHVHRIHHQDKTAMKSAVLKMLESYSTQPINSTVLGASVFDILTNNRDILSPGCRDYLYNTSAEAVNFLFTVLLKSKTLRDRIIHKHYHPTDAWSMEKLNKILEADEQRNENPDKEN